MPRILAPNQSFHRSGSQRSVSSRSSRVSLSSEPPLRRSSLPSRGYRPAYDSAFSLKRRGPPRRQTHEAYTHTSSVQQSKENAQWDLQGPTQLPKTLSKESMHTAATIQASSVSSSVSTLPSTNNGTSASGLAAAFALLMQQKSGGVPKKPSEPQSVPCSPHSTSTYASSLDPISRIREEPDCWGQFVDVQSATEDFDKRSRVVRRFPGAPHSLPRGY